MLANDNLITQTQTQIAEILNADSDLSAIGFLIENRFDIETEIQTRLKKQGICGIIMTPTLTFQGISDDRKDIVYQCDNLTIQITEYVPINRAKNKTSCQTSQDIAIKVADVLGSPSYTNWQNFQVVDIQTGEDNGLLVSKVTVQCLVRGDLSALPSPYDPSVKIPYALKTQLDELSVYFEEQISSIPIGYTKTESDDKFQPKGDYATKSDLNKKLDNSSEFITLSTTNDGLKIADNAGVYDTTYSINQIVTNYPDSNYKVIELPSVSRTIATESYVDSEITDIKNIIGDINTILQRLN